MSADAFTPPDLDTLAALLPGYDFEAFIAQGGMGAVYKARQRSLDRDVAIKILPREFGEDAEFRQSFETEAKAMARLNHPNLIAVYDYGDAGGMPYIVMEYVNGKSLFYSAHNLAVEPRQAVTIVKAIAEGLAHAHENGVIHRDVKPANILLTPKAEPKVGDFGLARPAGEGSTGLLMGTPGYTAPEVTRQPDHADHRSDIFALGVMLYELLIGRCPPYDFPPPPASSLCGCDPALDVIISRATHPVADMRHPTAEAFATALDNWLRGSGSLPAAAAGLPGVGTHAAPRVKEVVHVSSSGGSNVGTHAAIILVLLVASYFAWKKLGSLEEEKVARQAAYKQRVQSGDTEADPRKPSPQDTAAKPRPTGAIPDFRPRDKPAPAGDEATPKNPPDLAARDNPKTTPGGDSADDAPDIAAGNMTPGLDAGGFDPADPIEPPAPLPPEIAELEEKARQLVANLESAREKELTKNARTFTWDLDTWHNSLSKGDQLTWKPHVERMKSLVRAGRVPDKIDTDSGINLSDRMVKIADFCARKQRSLDADFDTKAARIRDAYVSRVRDSATKAETAGDQKTSRMLAARADTSIELKEWLRLIHTEEDSAFVLDSIGGAPAPTPSFKVISATYGAQGKDADVTEKVREWLVETKERFHVNPGDLGEDPNPGWNKKLVLLYELDGHEIRAEWWEGAPVEMAALFPEHIERPANAEPVIGAWIWVPGNTVFTFRADGTASVAWDKGTWEAVEGGEPRTYRITWDSGSSDTVVISEDGNSLTGINQKDQKPFTGTRFR